MGSSFGNYLKVTTFGESHGVALGCIVDNVPAGLELTEHDIQIELERRKPGQSNISTPRREDDIAKIISGTFQGKTLGSPITIVIENTNNKSKDYEKFKEVYRPSHADYTTQEKYGYRSYLGGARSSARTTIGLVAAGAIAKKILRELTQTEICAYVSRVHSLSLDETFLPPRNLDQIKELQKTIEKTPVRCPDLELSKKIEKHIQQVRQEGDSLGGTIDAIALPVPLGLGSPVFDRLDALLAHVLMSIPAVKSVEIGSGVSAPFMKGSEHNDLFFKDTLQNKISTHTNFSGGIQGGISNGEPIVARIGFKPTATISKEQLTVDLYGNECTLKVKGRHDPCVLPRAVPIVEAAMAFVLADQLLLSKLSNYQHLSDFITP